MKQKQEYRLEIDLKSDKSRQDKSFNGIQVIKLKNDKQKNCMLRINY